MAQRRKKKLGNLQAIIGSIPMISVAVGVYVICIIYSITLSFTSSRLFPKFNFVGLKQYERLWGSPRWQISVENIWLFGFLLIAFTLIVGYLLAVFMDQRIKQEGLFRTIFLYPFAMSLVVTGLVWQWVLDPNLGVQSAMANWGFEWFKFAPLVNPETAIYGVIIAGVWQGTGVTMAILLAGIRGIDEDIWKASKVDGIPAWRTYFSIVLPMMKGAVATAFVLQCVSVVRVYDLIVAITNGGPGIATQMPAVFVIEHISIRQNAGVGMAAATLMLLPIIILLGGRGIIQWRAAKIEKEYEKKMLQASAEVS
ncbi:MAG: sugar ABC transporter permease [SAR324 cluster bacterium]|nr:sugar ABC transporter permease [SAR324 cluster bacterium]